MAQQKRKQSQVKRVTDSSTKKTIAAQSRRASSRRQPSENFSYALVGAFLVAVPLAIGWFINRNEIEKLKRQPSEVDREDLKRIYEQLATLDINANERKRKLDTLEGKLNRIPSLPELTVKASALSQTEAEIKKAVKENEETEKKWEEALNIFKQQQKNPAGSSILSISVATMATLITLGTSLKTGVKPLWSVLLSLGIGTGAGVAVWAASRP